MPSVNFTANLDRHLDCPNCVVAAANVREALESVFQQNPRLRGYLLDDQHCVRQHITIFVDGRPIRDRKQQSDALVESSEVFVMQALSGG